MKWLNSICLLIFVSALALTGCSSTQATNVKNTSPKTEPVVVAEKIATPTEVTKNFLEAVRERNYRVVRENLSQRSLTNLQQASTSTNLNLDQALKRIVDQDAQGMLANNVTSFDFRNETILTDQASLEVKASNAPSYARISLTKENNRWKVNIDETTTGE
ncbi:MAG: DUF4878 domain-containing protein [Blastocatellia bacterium]|nr:DUF4878 domain-containing protein [Blastocatellia bacterium]MBL8194399.1 DUF4878 domain-containing protein [Blastocatellia bacterium]MBN8725618.1 DUF4878 domain-containing protein [Acidobacteriota bacterium]